MNLEAAYLEAALPEPVVLLGQKLEPYSLGHEMLRRRFAASVPSVESALLSIFICCHRYEQALAALRDPHLVPTIHAWRKKLSASPRLPISASSSFEAYRQAGSKGPKFKRIRKGQRSPFGAPWLLGLLNTLMGPLNQSWSDAHNFPYGQAQWAYCAYWESQGNIRISDESEEELYARVVAAARACGLEPIRLTK